jgi:hypothetical protein
MELLGHEVVNQQFTIRLALFRLALLGSGIIATHCNLGAAHRVVNGSNNGDTTMTSQSYALNAARVMSLVLLALVLSTATVLADETKTLTLDARDLRMLKIDAGAGFLEIEGSSGDTIEVVAEIIADDGDYRFTLDRRGDRAVLISEVEPLAGFFVAKHARIDLTVKVPARLALDIDDGSGHIELKGMRAMTAIDDGSGEITVRDHRGDLSIDDGSGPIDVSDVTGKVKIHDGSGPINVRNVVGNLRIKDGSGPMEIKKIDGRVTLRDGSGPIDVSDITGGLNILDSGSGGVSTRNIVDRDGVDEVERD